MAKVQKVTYRFNVISIKATTSFFTEIEGNFSSIHTNTHTHIERETETEAKRQRQRDRERER
jgi:hypothetical protein